jgi:isoquinoline 1-oxidoreductase alpha subunit
MAVLLDINGVRRQVETDPSKPLLWVLREDLKLFGVRYGCGAGICGACTVHADGAPVRSCQIAAGDAAAMKIVTIEQLVTTPAGRRLADSWTALDVPQCGYCQSGQIMSAAALLRDKPAPTDADIDEAMAGNLCRCATYVRIRAAIHRAAGAGKSGGSHDA